MENFFKMDGEEEYRKGLEQLTSKNTMWKQCFKQVICIYLVSLKLLEMF